jgi:uncharacterized damage-inducible protein DinB
MSRVAVDTLLYLVSEAFEGNGWHALLPNIRSVPDEAWLWVPPGGGRSARDIVDHVGGAKRIYDYAFKSGTLPWDDPSLDELLLRSKRFDAEVEAWLREGHRRWVESIDALDDAELVRLRKRHRGELAETRWLISVMIEHDLYHAGEINHIRALYEQNDL